MYTRRTTLPRFYRVAVFLLSAVGLCGQELTPQAASRSVAHGGRPIEMQSRPIRVGVNMVLVPVLVTDNNDRPVLGLPKEAFHVFEDGVEQEVISFSSQERPTSIGILFDSSGSMVHKLVDSRQAVSKFLSLSSRDDEFFLIKFADRPELVSPFSKDAGEIEAGLNFVRPLGWTALFDAIYLGIHQMRHAGNDRKALLIVSDGGDNNSRYTEREIKAMVQEGDVRIFAVSIQDHSPVLERLAEESGGRAFRVRKLKELQEVAATISEQLHSEYVLGYAPKLAAPDGKYRKLTIKTSPPDQAGTVRSSWRRGYYAPGE